MAEEIENEQIDEFTEETTTVEEQENKPKGFTQVEVNRIVQNRLKEGEIREHESEISGFQEQLTTYENIIQEMIKFTLKRPSRVGKKAFGEIVCCGSIGIFSE